MIKLVKVSIPSYGGYSRSEFRIVDGPDDCKGYKHEKGVSILWRSDSFYDNCSKGSRSRYHKILEGAKAAFGSLLDICTVRFVCNQPLKDKE